jgi:hypothetical protein
MTNELEDALYRDFPGLYQDLWGGIDCDDGWEPLLRSLSEKISPLGVLAIQVKEKFGQLRFYYVGGTPETTALIHQAEVDSATICEVCGAPGENRESHSWWKTTCEAHAKE